jgi:hypothetical protein
MALATAILVNSFPITNRDLETSFCGNIHTKIHGEKILVAESPLGEPIEDIKLAICDNSWKSYVWELSDVVPLAKLVPVRKRSHSPWSHADVEEAEESAKKGLITSYF